VKPILDRIMPPLWRWYVRKPRISRHGDVSITVPPGVFHPGLFISTRFMMEQIDGLDLGGKTLLELGAGSGMVAIVAAKRGAIVTATDISSLAVKAIQTNAKANQVEMVVQKADLFVGLQQMAFDFVIINPPYYPENPKDEAEHAWFCGKDFDYFKRLFQDLDAYVHSNSQVLMVLSEDCKLDRIAELANNQGWQMQIINQRTQWGERNYIFKIFR
jgi:release factor glutamine methyltransferase